MSGENKTKIFFGKCLVISKKLSNFAEQNRNNSHLGCLIRPKRKDAGAVDRDGLENRCTFTGTQGSNPCLSATDENQFTLYTQGKLILFLFD